MRASALKGILATAVVLGAFAGPTAAQNVEMQFGTTSPPGNVQYYSSEEFIKQRREIYNLAGIKMYN